MRINLRCPFQDKDLAKQRGARWDPGLRVWYIQDVDDLAPFAAWLPATAGAPSPKQTSSPRPATDFADAAQTSVRGDKRQAATTGPSVVSHCGCDVLPWDDCACSRAAGLLIPSGPGTVAMN